MSRFKGLFFINSISLKVRLLVKANLRSFLIPINFITSKVSTLLKEKDFTGENIGF